MYWGLAWNQIRDLLQTHWVSETPGKGTQIQFFFEWDTLKETLKVWGNFPGNLDKKGKDTVKDCKKKGCFGGFYKFSQFAAPKQCQIS